MDDDQILRWVEGVPPSFAVPRDQTRALDLTAWQAAVDQLQPGAGRAYSELGQRGEFGPWWQSAVGGRKPGIRRFCLQLPERIWERPWEGLVGALDRERWPQVSIIRQTASDAAPVHPSELSSALKVLCIQGHPKLGEDELNLEAELRALHAAHDALDFAARTAIARPIASKARCDLLESALLEHQPAVLWFSGHARATPPGLLLEDGHWLGPQELAWFLRSARAKGGRTPLYVVLWACRTGSASLFAEPGPAPAFVDALAAEGVAALLVSQAPLADDVARRVAGDVFAALASGMPLDHGVTQARAELMRGALESVDWMCPVVWSKGRPPPALHWTDGREQGVRRQGIGRKLLPARLQGVLDQPCANQPWPVGPRIWVTATSLESEGSRMEWARRVLARQGNALHTVLWLDASPATASTSAALWLRDWAQRVSEVIEDDDDPTTLLRTAAAQIERDPEGGWRSLCSNDWFLLAIVQPPARGADWLWSGLRDGNAEAIVLSDDFSDERAMEGWTVNTLIEPVGVIEPSTTLTGLALLSCPAAKSDIEEVTGKSIDDFVTQGLVVESSAGCVMPANIGERIAMTLTPEERLEGHGLAYDFLTGNVTQRKLTERDREDILLARLRHARFANFADGVQAEGENLIRLYHRRRRSAALLEVLSGLIGPDWYPSCDLVVAIAWAYLALGDPESAISWLQQYRDESSAEWLVVRAEAEKSSGGEGSKSRARSYLERALACLDGVEDEQATTARLHIKHDLARLTHFFDRSPASAIALYEEVLREWEGVPFSDLDRAITTRNLAEALKACGRGKDAETKARQARDLIPMWTQHAVVAELEYLRGRIAIDLEHNEAEIVARFQECREKALQTSHMMLVAIVDSRLFWRLPDQQSEEMFDDSRWTERVEKLTPFEQHAWVARVLIKGHLRAARRLSGSRGEHSKARAELAAALRLVEANPSFDQGSDRERSAVLHAGLAIYAGGAERWTAWRQQHTWSSEFADDPSQVWQLAG